MPNINRLVCSFEQRNVFSVLFKHVAADLMYLQLSEQHELESAVKSFYIVVTGK